MGRIVSPQKLCRSPNSCTCERDLIIFVERIFADETGRVQVGPLGRALIQRDRCPHEKRRVTETETSRENPCDDRGRDWHEASTSHGMPRITGNPTARVLPLGVWQRPRLCSRFGFRLQNYDVVNFCC